MFVLMSCNYTLNHDIVVYITPVSQHSYVPKHLCYIKLCNFIVVWFVYGPIKILLIGLFNIIYWYSCGKFATFWEIFGKSNWLRFLKFYDVTVLDFDDCFEHCIFVILVLCTSIVIFWKLLDDYLLCCFLW